VDTMNNEEQKVGINPSQNNENNFNDEKSNKLPPLDDAEEKNNDETDLSQNDAKTSAYNGTDSSQDDAIEPNKNDSSDDRGSTSDYEVIDNATSQ